MRYSRYGEETCQSAECAGNRHRSHIDVFDADSVVRDPKKPDWYDDRYHQGDYLHPNAEGGRVLAEAYDLQMLTGEQI